MIYDVVMFFVEKGEQIKEFVDSVLDSSSRSSGRRGRRGGQPIEGTLCKIVPLLLGFLASLLGLGGIGEKIREILEKVQKPVKKASTPSSRGLEARGADHQPRQGASPGRRAGSRRARPRSRARSRLKKKVQGKAEGG